MTLHEVLSRIYHISLREVGIMRQNPIYGFCTVIFPIVVIIFFTTLMAGGQPTEMPIGIVDQDNTTTTRAMVRQLDAFQSSKVAGYYPNVNAAREAIQRNEIFAFLYIPKGTTSGLMTSTQPKVSFYYSNVTLVAGNIKTKLQAIGKTDDEVRTFLQPIAVDTHLIQNPWVSYNIYLTTSMAPGVLMVFIFLLTPYSIGTELKFKRSRQLMKMAGNNIYIAIAGKILPMTLLFLTMMYGFEFYIFHTLDFPHPGGVIPLLLMGLLSVLACQGFGIFAFGLMPSLRMSISISALWSVLSFSVAGATYPLSAMDPEIQSLAQLFPLRHYFMLYQMCEFNGYPLSYAWFNIMFLLMIAVLPIFTLRNIKRAMLVYVYIP